MSQKNGRLLRTGMSARRKKNDFGKAVSRILSAQPLVKPAANRRLYKRLGRESFVSAASTRNPFRWAKHGAGSSRVPYLALHPMGFSVPPGLRPERWALTPPFHPCRAHASTRAAVCFLWHCPSGCLTAPLPACIRTPWHPVTRHRALWCSDFPPPPSCPGESDPPPFQNRE
jgi:hypothetical protein